MEAALETRLPGFLSVHPRSPTRLNPLGRYTPKSLSDQSRRRFWRERTTEYLARIDGAPTTRQATLIEKMIKLEWSSLVVERQSDVVVGLREAREHTRLFTKLLQDFEESLPKPAAKA